MDNINEKDLEFRKVFAKRLKMLRIDKKMTLKELATALQQKYEIEITYGSISNYERAFRIPSLNVLANIANYFDVTSDYLLGITDERNAKILQTSIYDDNNTKHSVKIAVDKDSKLADMPLKDVVKLVKELQELGIDFNTIKKPVE
ncbi:helix-turn-helix transcriptional regulator [Clostridium sp.]|uniref:helix-turn-helix domain-containing protein n=1 Tax=Clostridium sp. TaxID=1506 RepID=UPI001A554F5B|nr:helix-turn-helix transcriptional regulator [Clostridium sp.]MBK5236758.1 helix-turn-helix transcriptional regulator [Clostridium sp.]